MAKTITITCNDDGSYGFSVDAEEAGETNEAAETAATKPQVVQSVDEVLQLVQASLADGGAEGGPDAQTAWNQEAAARETPAEDTGDTL